MRLVRPQDVDGTIAFVDGGSWAVTVQHIENDWKNPVKRTTLMWAGTDWGDGGDGFQPGCIRRSAVVGPLVENTERAPFYSMSLDEIRIDRTVVGGALWGRLKEPRELIYEDAGHDLEAGRDAAFAIALRHCSYDYGADAPAKPRVATMPFASHQRQSNFGLVNRVVVLAFKTSRGSRLKGRTSPLSAIKANLGEALFKPSFEKCGERTDLIFENGIALDSLASSDNAEQLRGLIGDLPVVTAGVQRARLGTLNDQFGRAGLPLLDANQRLSVNVSGLGHGDLARDADDVLAAAGTRKRLDSGWLTPRLPRD